MIQVLLTAIGAFFLVLGPARSATCTGNDIRLKVCLLEPAYNKESKLGDDYRSPTCQSGVTPDQRTHVENAFNIAPDKIKDELCRLKKIFIADRSFGLWENPASPSFMGTGKASYVAIDGNVISHSPSSPKPTALPEVEDSLIQSVLLKFDPTSAPSTWTGHSATVSSGTDTTPLAVLSQLTHELGHIKWYRDNIDSSLACFDTDFIDRSWHRGTLRNFYDRRWTALSEDPGADHRPGKPTRHPRDIQGKADAVHLRNLYNQGFASALAAVTPDEDFVETFKLVVLRNAKSTTATNPLLNSLTLEIKPNGSPLTVDVLNNSMQELADKASCVRPLVCLSPSTC